MIGTIEALGVFLLAILPGFLALRIHNWSRPPLRPRGTLGELGVTVAFSAVAWTVLYLWRGQELLPTVLGEPTHTTSDRLDAFAELAALSFAIGVAVGLVTRVSSFAIRAGLLRRLRREGQPGSSRPNLRPRALIAQARRRFWREVHARTLPAYAWDRLLSRLVEGEEAVLCRVNTRSGAQIFGVLADGWLDYEVDGRGVYFDLELAEDEAGQLRTVTSSRGLYIPGDEISVMSVIGLQGAVSWDADG